MKLFLSLALLLVATKQANAQCASDITFCGGDIANMPDPSLVINPAEPCAPDSQETTCEEVLMALEMGVLPAEQCDMVMMVQVICCPSLVPQSCFICGDTDSAFNEAKLLPGADGMTCGGLNEELKMVPPEMCAQLKGMAGVNLASMCECPGAVAPDTCKVCGNGQTVNTTAIVDEEDGMTCGAGIEVAKHVTNQTMCNMVIATADNKKKCCIDAAASKSGGIGLSISSLVTALIAGLAFAI